MMFISSIDGTLTGSTILGQIGTRKDVYEGIFHILKISGSEASPLDTAKYHIQDNCF